MDYQESFPTVLLAGFCLLSSATPLLAGAQPLTLRACVAEALRGHPSLAVNASRHDEAVARVPQVRSLPAPMMDVGLFLRELETRVGPQRARLGLSQALPSRGLLRARGRLAVEGVSLVEDRRRELEEGVVLAVTEAFFELAHADGALAIMRENLELLRYLESVARSRYRAGVEGHGAVIRAQVEAARLEERIASLEALRAPLMRDLAEAMGRDDPEGIGAPVLPSRPSTEEEPARAAKPDDLLTGNPSLRRMERRIALARLEEKVVRREERPLLHVGLSWFATGEALNPSVVDSGKDPLLATVRFDLPFFRRRALRAKRREARSRRETRTRELREVESTLREKLARTLYGIADARRKWRLFSGDLLVKAHEALSVTRSAFVAGRAGFTDVLDAQRSLLELRLAALRADVDERIGRARLDRLEGRGAEHEADEIEG